MHDMASQPEKPHRPLLRYHGGKWMIGRWIISHFPEHRIYVEPYCGAASVFMQKPRSFMEVINDLDDEIVNLFQVLRDSRKAKRLIELLELTPWARTEFWNCYEATASPVEKARRMVARSFMAFGTTGRRKNRTGFRGKAERQNNTGINDWHNYPKSLAVVVKRLQGVCVENRPALEILSQQDDDETLFYLDPTYPFDTRTAIRYPSRNDRAYAHEMTDDDHRELAKALHSIKGMAIISGYRCDLYDKELYSDWESFEKKTFADGGKKRTEVIWINGAAMKRRKHLQKELFT